MPEQAPVTRAVLVGAEDDWCPFVGMLKMRLGRMCLNQPDGHSVQADHRCNEATVEVDQTETVEDTSG